MAAITPVDAERVASDISKQLTAIISDVNKILHEDCKITGAHMDLCKVSMEELLAELSEDATQMEGFIFKMQQLLTELNSVETLAVKLNEIKETLGTLENLAMQIL
ncbi:uncharacterized protein MONOS_11965 [Monocercomonoides exilis]|uniref:uncharacterized protein n=1 Tax=Monocercomonoides exilis TaxID=2049356 RepID=UPI00355944C6|nr:hypothetical protein MONOS_11965 [Monocercomonoides exilis]|eukprot:MONOS_11965.1-p1 / transcript=MONOS_11965.1 / gene=MONOS_11965 / organism=Monocercomonoides_exilis_PA203 / gene_product=unspecified product / transcript_product=unspecified product / location=Mono_scaffold00631:21719-22167(+) / protein_length=106 / sequence_SO=supercontig / SO=protein_coding / is_pseudo=false